MITIYLVLSAIAVVLIPLVLTHTVLSIQQLKTM